MPKEHPKILVVDDQEDIRELLKYNLTKEGYEVKTASDGVIGLKVAKEYLPDLILLDIMMPNQDGVETCRQIRHTPSISGSFIVFLTARSEEYSEISAFDSGADDYIIKPIKPRALISRINAHFRRQTAKGESSKTIEAGGLLIDSSSYNVTINGEALNFPKKEFELLFFLASHQGKVYSRETLIRKIWGTDVYVLNRTVDVHIRKVREKIGEGYILTLKGVGYKFELSK